MVIDNATLLQVNTSAIVGFFIFLTLQGFGSTRFSLMQTRAIIARTLLLGIPFAFPR